MPAPLPALLTTERLRLRAWRPAADAALVRTLWSERDRRARWRIDADGHPTVEEMETRLAEQLATSARTGLALLALERRAEGDVVGYCGLVTGQSSAEEPELADELLRRVHGRGYATEAAAAVVDAATTAGLPRLWATVRVWNAPSLRVLEKLGFHDSGRLDRDPERGDTVWMTRDLRGPAVSGYGDGMSENTADIDDQDSEPTMTAPAEGRPDGTDGQSDQADSDQIHAPAADDQSGAEDPDAPPT